ncbi:MAG: hypothetical protein WCV88_00135 [Patescibacteria group bacterium]|jgi:hypothetical protein
MKKYTSILPLGLTVLLGLGVGCTTPSTTTNTSATSTDETALIADDTITVETSDVYGKDIDGVTRYPDSIRSYYSKNDSEADVTYQTTAGVEEVRQYFNDQLTKAGWTNSEEATDYMEYIKGDSQNPEIMTVYFTEYKTQGVVEYELVDEAAMTDTAELDF